MKITTNKSTYITTYSLNEIIRRQNTSVVRIYDLTSGVTGIIDVVKVDFSINTHAHKFAQASYLKLIGSFSSVHQYRVEFKLHDKANEEETTRFIYVSRLFYKRLIINQALKALKE